MRAEYDFSKLKTVRGKYAARFARGTNLVLIDPELAKAFPTDEAVNETLRDALKMAARISKPISKPSKSPRLAPASGK